MTRAMLLCAGKGTRLGELSSEKPKPLLPVCDMPILQFGIANLVARGITEIVINLHHRGALIREVLGDGSRFGAQIRYSEEEEILGTGGGLKHALSLLDPEGSDEPFLSLNGKLIFDLDIESLLASYQQDQRAGEPSCGTMVVKPVPNALEWGAVDVRPQGDRLRVHNILGEGTYMFCGVHVTRPSVVRDLPEGEACMVRQGYLPWLHAGQQVNAFVHSGGYFAEHSTPERYLQGNIDLLSNNSLTNPPGPMQGVAESAQVHESCKLVPPFRVGPGVRVEAGAQIGPNVVLGAGALVKAGSKLSECVVWERAHVEGVHHRAIITECSTLCV